MKVSIRKIGFVVLLFIYIFAPPVLPIGTGLIMSMAFVVYFLCNYYRIQKGLHMKDIMIIALFLIVMIVGVVASYVNIYNGTQNILPFISNYIYILSYSLLGAVLLCDLGVKFQFSKPQIWKYIIYAGIMQSVLGGLAFAIPEFQTLLCFFLKNIMSSDTIAWWRNYRLYGLACGLTFSMPIAQTLIGGLTILYAKAYNEKFYFWVPILWGTAIINARVTIVIIFIEIIVLCFNRLKFIENLRVKRTTLLILFILSLMLGGALIAIVTQNIDVSRITDPIDEIISLLRGKTVFRTNGYLAYFYSDPKAFVIPSKEKMLFGGGIWNCVSDIGYIYDLWAGGICHCLFLYVSYIILMRREYIKLKRELEEFCKLIVMLGISIFTSNIKGDIFGSMNEVQNLFFLLAGTILFIKGKEEKNNIE